MTGKVRRTFFLPIYAAVLFSSALLFSCSSTKYVADDEYLLDKVSIDSDVPDWNTLEIRPYIRQLPNFKMFGLNKTMFQVYNLSGRDSSRWHNRFLKKIGEEPVIFDSLLVYKTSSELEKLFFNLGYMNVEVSSDIIRKNKKAEVKYIIRGNTPYRINEYEVQIPHAVLENELIEAEKPFSQNKVQGERASMRTSLIHKGMLFDRNVLDAERDRISGLLRNRGYYAFNKYFITFDADSSLNNYSVNLEMKLDPLSSRISASAPNIAPTEKYRLDHVYMYLDYDPLTTKGISEYSPSDSVLIGGYTVYYKGKKPSIRPRTLINNNYISPGSAFSQIGEEATYSALSSLSALSNAYIQYEAFMQGDSSLLKCHIMTVPAEKQTYQYSIEGTNTEGDLGVATSVNYSHRNLFRGSESLDFKIRGAFEAIHNRNPYFEFGSELSLQMPKFVFPFIKNSFSREMRGSTQFSLSYNYQNRPEYGRTIFSGGLRYLWQQSRISGRHRFSLFDVDYVFLPYIEQSFLDRLPDGAEFFGYTDQFIVGSGYTYSKTNADPANKHQNAYSVRFSFESAGNALYLLSNWLNAKKDDQGSYKLFNTYYAQFLKTDFDYSKNMVIDAQNTIAWRIGGGIGYPYGNSKMLPFEKRYYSGGANSVRAWHVRELGPGSYIPNDSTTFFNQSGDIKLDFNIEYRTRFFWKFEAAAFIDAGNIWTIKDYDGQEGGRFSFDSFYKQIAVGYGLGLRMDFDFFLVRLDCGWKAYDPAKSRKDAWAILHPNFSSNWAWHFAVGYPF
jgi:outer membrane translocation and assembly module TamA